MKLYRVITEREGAYDFATKRTEIIRATTHYAAAAVKKLIADLEAALMGNEKK